MLPIIAISFLIIWSILPVYIGVTEMLEALGGSAKFYFLLPLIPILSLRHNVFGKLLFLIGLALTGLIVVNYLVWYFLNNYKEYGPLTRVYLISVPIGITQFSYTNIVQYFFNARSEKDTTVLKAFAGFLVMALTVPLSCVLLTVFLLQTEGIKNINSLSYQVGLVGLIVTALVLVLGTRRIPAETIHYFSNAIPRANFDIKKIRNWIVIGTSVFLLLSFFLEIYRQYWVTWIESAICFILFIILLWRFGKTIFMPILPEAQVPVRIYLPRIDYRTIIFISFAVPVLYVLILVLMEILS